MAIGFPSWFCEETVAVSTAATCASQEEDDPLPELMSTANGSKYSTRDR
jgi:hypothetical protein